MMYGANRSFKEVLNKFLDILKCENVFGVGSVEPLQIGRRPDKTTKMTGTLLS